MVRADGQIDWWCPNEFHAAPLLWSLLDERGGTAAWCGVEAVTWDAAPAGPTTTTVLRRDGRRFASWDGLVAHGSTTALVRLVQSQGRPFTVTHRLRAGGFDADRQVFEGASSPTSARLQIVGGDAHRIDAWTVETDVIARPDRWTGFAVLVDPASAQPLIAADLEQMLRRAEHDEARTMRRTRLPHHHPSRVIDALLVLHASTDTSSGAPVASPTSSLPEAIGGTRQFDYRYSWLRDSGNALAVASLLGHTRAAARYLDHVSSLLGQDGSGLKPVNMSSGGPVPSERTIDGVDGWGGSAPVRVGNGASGQRQMDSPTAVLEAIHVYVSCGGRMNRQTWSTVHQLADMLVDAPFGPSNGVWELREPQLLVSEELSRWVGLDRAIRLARRRRPWRRHPTWTAARDLAHARVSAALDPATGLLPQVFGGDPLATDASALLVAVNGFWPRTDPRTVRLVRATIERLEQRGFMRRYPPIDDGFEGEEGCFVPASWWAVSALAAIGDVRAAEDRADEMCAHLPPLQPEMWDVQHQQPLGNTPLLWSHTEAARALYNLHIARIRSRSTVAGVTVWRTFRALRLRLTAPHE
jgi:hypothetical protein